MSVPVELAKLRDSVARFGPLAYLVTAGANSRPHVVSVHVGWDDAGRLAARAGRGTLRNAAERPLVCLLWGPTDEEGFSLIVDGTASVEADRVLVRPETAVLHRQAAAPGEASASDCVTVLDHVRQH